MNSKKTGEPSKQTVPLVGIIKTGKVKDRRVRISKIDIDYCHVENCCPAYLMTVNVSMHLYVFRSENPCISGMALDPLRDYAGDQAYLSSPEILKADYRNILPMDLIFLSLAIQITF